MNDTKELVKIGLEMAECKLCFLDSLSPTDCYWSYAVWLNVKLHHSKKCKNRKKQTLYKLISKRVQFIENSSQ
jgi:hypothetical protein|tara:strand:+ start:1566 stop:1784 length:219 start_codon:yes stop_codon:yes gene_type:complete